MNTRVIETRRGARLHVLEAGNTSAPPLVFLHGVAGLLDDTTFFDLLAERHHVFAPELPGYGGSTGEELFEDMLDFSLHGWDIVAALDLVGQRPALIGHSLGGMIAAEMACLAPEAVSRLVLVDALGLWLDAPPVADLFALLPFEFGELLFFDPERARALLPGATDLADAEHLRSFFVNNARSLGTAGKMLFPIPNRRLSRRLYRLTTETLVVWGAEDRLAPPVYASRWAELLPGARLASIAHAGHMLPYEQPRALAQEVSLFLG